VSRVGGVALAVLVLGALASVPLVVTGTYYQFMLVIVFIYVIVATGLNILTGYAGQFSLGHAGFFAIGAYTTALVSKGLAGVPGMAASGLNVWTGVVAGTVLSCLFGVVLAYPALRVSGPYLAMVTIAFGWVIWKVLLEWVPVTGGDLGITSIPKARIGGLVLDTARFYYVAMALALGAVLLQRNIVESNFGRKLQAIKHSELAASSIGIDVFRSKITVFVLSAGFAGVGGALFAHQQNYINPDNFKFFDSVFFLLAILFGGAGTLLGSVVGAAVLTLLPELLHDFDHYRLIVYSVIILLTLYVLPRGVCGTLLPERRAAADRGIPRPRRTESDLVDRSKAVTTTGGPVLQVRGLRKAFGGVQALAGVSLEVVPATIHALIGPNGSGKTTLLNLVSGVYLADAGEVRWKGAPVRFGTATQAARAGIARTFQTVKLFGPMTVLEHVLVGFERRYTTGLGHAMWRARRARHEHEEAVERAGRLLSFVGLAGLEHVPANSLPYGHRRLVEIARALAVEPELLLLDEPAAGLIVEEIQALDRLIVKLRTAGITVLLVEHHMDLVMSISDRVTVLNYGEVIAQGSPKEVQTDSRVIEAYLGPSYRAAG
jgi:branched-chain amino acid transport system permease protein